MPVRIFSAAGTVKDNSVLGAGPKDPTPNTGAWGTRKTTADSSVAASESRPQEAPDGDLGMTTGCAVQGGREMEEKPQDAAKLC